MVSSYENISFRIAVQIQSNSDSLHGKRAVPLGIGTIDVLSSPDTLLLSSHEYDCVIFAPQNAETATTKLRQAARARD